MISFFKRLFKAAKPAENSPTDTQVDFAIGDLKKGFILDYSKSGNLVGIEVLNASKSSINPAKVEYEAI